MTTGKVVLVTVLAGTISIAFAIFGKRWVEDGTVPSLPPALTRDRAGERLDSLPDFRLPDLAGRELASSTWAGKVLVVNFWATWCPPCVREMPLLAALQQEHLEGGLQVVGIAIDEPEEVRRFLAENPVNYPILLGDTEAIEMSRRLGNRLQGLPFTVVFDRYGKRVAGRVGEVTRTTLDEWVGDLLPPRPRSGQTAGN